VVVSRRIKNNACLQLQYALNKPVFYPHIR
jgi:hypothetical protein